jgi:hypothetical protein
MNIYENCSLCENPYPYKCEECISIIQETEGEVQKISPFKYVGSGEDACLDTYTQSIEKMLT